MPITSGLGINGRGNVLQGLDDRVVIHSMTSSKDPENSLGPTK